MKGTVLSKEEAGKAKKHFADLLTFIQGDSISVPKRPDKEVMFRSGSFSPGVCPALGEKVAVAEISGHPAPNPVFMHGRNANAWFSLLFRKRNRDHPTLNGLDSMVVSTSTSHDDICVLLPACPDLRASPKILFMCFMFLKIYLPESMAIFAA